MESNKPHNKSKRLNDNGWKQSHQEWMRDMFESGKRMEIALFKIHMIEKIRKILTLI